MLTKVKCAGIVFWKDTVLLVRDPKARDPNKWRVPERELHDDEDIMLCIRRCILEQTGYRANTLRLFRIVHYPSLREKTPTIRFVFGCEIHPGQLQQPIGEVSPLEPDAVLKLAEKGNFDDRLLLRILRDFKAGLPPISEPII